MLRYLPYFLLLCGLLRGATAQPALTPEGVRELQDRVVALYEPLVNATVAIFPEDLPGSGSGVIVSPDGLVMTAAHVGEKPGRRLRFLLADGTIATGVTLGVDHNTDAALAHIDGASHLPFRPVARTADYEAGDWVMATGHPGGPVVGRPAPLRLGRIITAGKASGFDDPIITDCTVISGDSGGPLFNLSGEVIGIHSNISGPWSNNQHVPLGCFLGCWQELLDGKSGTKESAEATSHSVDVLTSDEFLRQMTIRHRDLLASHRDESSSASQLDRPVLLYPHEMQRDFDRWSPDPSWHRNATLGLRFDPTSRLPLVSDVIPDGPAANAGVHAGDRILAAGGRDGLTLVELLHLLSSSAPATKMALKIGRGDKTLHLVPTTGSCPARRDFGSATHGLLSEMPLLAAKAEAASAGRSAVEVKESLGPFTASAVRSVVTILHEGRKVALGTVIDANGGIITKASEIGNEGDLVCRVGDEDRPLIRSGVDQATDLALLKADPSGLAPVVWAENPAQPGLLLFGAGPGGVFRTVGTVCRPPAPCPAEGFEYPASPDNPPSMSATLDPDASEPVVQSVRPDGAADRAGIREGDLITSFNGAEVKTTEALREALAASVAGMKTTVTVKRGEENLTLQVILDKPSSDAAGPSPMARARDALIEGLSASGGKLNKRRRDFPLCIYHDSMLKSDECGGPLLDTGGKVLGIDIARALRTRSLAIPAMEVQNAIKRILAKTK